MRYSCGGILVALLALILHGGPVVPAQPPAFPGAEGFGAQADGWRRPMAQVLFVTNLNANGPGSLQAALDTPGPRYILFRVSGVIETQVHVARGECYIAGQTSPGGIIVRGMVSDETPYQENAATTPTQYVENWCLRYLRVRPGGADDTAPSDDGLRLRYTRRAIVDHCSIANAHDEMMEISYSNQITVQHSLFAETTGAHAWRGGMLLAFTQPATGFELDRISVHHNCWTRLMGRLPEAIQNMPEGANRFMQLEFSNNYYHDCPYYAELWSETNRYGEDNTVPSYPAWVRANWVGNVAFQRPTHPYAFFEFQTGFSSYLDPTYQGSAMQHAVYLHDNRMNLYPDRQDWAFNYPDNDYTQVLTQDLPVAPDWAIATRNPFPSISYVPSGALRELVTAQAGCLPRDPMDRRLIGHVAAGTFDPAPQDTNPHGDTFLFDWTTPPAPPVDSDDDGMPDAWESARGLDPGTFNATAHTLDPQYQNLEVYLNDLAMQVSSSVPRNAARHWSLY